MDEQTLIKGYTTADGQSSAVIRFVLCDIEYCDIEDIEFKAQKVTCSEAAGVNI